MSERRFNDAEVAAIFEQASKAPVPGQRHLPSSEGMTLAQLQDIGREVGIAPEQLAEAAKSIELGGRATSQSFIGLPIGVGVNVELGRRLTDAEWERVVVDLRETFDARGKQSQEGSFRQWTNGNLQALLEPSATGHRLRLRTEKGDARGLIGGGIAMTVFASLAMGAGVLRGAVDDLGFLMALGTLGTMGLTMLGAGALRLPGWARLRRKQMESLAARAAVIASQPPADPARELE
jgi:hypothetical protein